MVTEKMIQAAPDRYEVDHLKGAPLDVLIAVIREHHRAHRDLVKANTSLTNNIKGQCRRFIGGEDFATRKCEGLVLYTCITGGDAIHPLAEVAFITLEPFLRARAALEPDLKAERKVLEKLAKWLPVWPWVESINGMGALGLAQIVGEAGGLSNYANSAKLWKRLGVGMVPVGDGTFERQRSVSGRDPDKKKAAAKAERAKLHAYSPQRRAIIWNIGDALIKKQNEYREVYLTRKEYEAEAHPDLTPMHRHRRAQRYMEKRLLLNLWAEWRRVCGGQRGHETHSSLAPAE